MEGKLNDFRCLFQVVLQYQSSRGFWSTNNTRDCTKFTMLFTRLQRFSLNLKFLHQTLMDGSQAEEVPTDMCGLNSHRKNWAKRKCSVITGELFKV